MDKSALEALLERIEAELQRKEVPIPHRPIEAIREFGRRTPIVTGLPMFPDEFGPDDYSDLAIGSQILRWYDAKYGDRLKVDHGPGSVVILVDGSAWEMRFPDVGGQVEFQCHRRLAESRLEPEFGDGSTKLTYNILQSLVEFPDTAAANLEDAELHRIANRFIRDLDLLETLERQGGPYIAEGLADLRVSVTTIVEYPPHYGLSKWSSLQFLEKVMKSRLGPKLAAKYRTHKLESIAVELRVKLSVHLDPRLIELVQCVPGVRYGEVKVSMGEAVAAHEAALTLAKELTPESFFAWESPTD